MKGVNLNLSGSGMSLSAGVRGASVTIGKKGTYLNTGIPGTGISQRTKIGSGSSQPIKKVSSDTNAQLSSDTAIVSVVLDERGSPILSIKDSYGRAITDENILRKVKRSDKYKREVEGLMERTKKSLDEETEKFINISKLTPIILTEAIIQNELNNLKPKLYIPEKYKVEEPNLEKIRQLLAIQANNTIKNVFFWKNKKLRETFINSKLQSTYESDMNYWRVMKEKFDKQEIETKLLKDKEYSELFLKDKTRLESIINGDTNYVNEKIESIINEITLPMDFTVDYEYHSKQRQLKIDLDLPEVEDIPIEKANILSSGKISIKNKTQKEIKQEYSQCVCGIAFYLTGRFFNISTNINELIVSGYTQRVNKNTGNIEDQYIYSVKFERNKFSAMNFKNVDPLSGFSNFENQMNISNNYDFKTILPW